ncbi:hypothetical protein GCM10027055_27510 [Janibacter alkaliphilus]|uniref:HTH OST-type domain-containing protein n=1 Tax=Janibacter alkaliphilus TaxID=1069963 RepID=A0A852X6M4_9MICO|nr:hypothetical protein [Janibacter alkaliphilus]
MDSDVSSLTRIAVLIDADNVSARHASDVLEELARYGTPTVKRAYGDWTTTQLTGWKSELHRNAIQPVQQFAYTVGKNSSDSALIIDAMDLLWQGNVEAFALVSSDSDFTRLATRLRESGRRVYGIGRRKTPESLRRAVDQFIFLEVLGRDEDATGGGAEPAAGEASTDGGSERPTINLESALTKAVNATSDDDGWASLGRIGQHLSRAHADFDPRDFGHQKLSSLVAEQPYLETRTDGPSSEVRLRSRRRRATKSTSTKSTSTKTAAKGTSAKASATKGAATKTSGTKSTGRTKAAARPGGSATD